MQTKLKEGERLFTEGKIKEAERCFLAFWEENPDNVEVLNNLGVIHHTQGNLQEAEQYFLKALAIKEDYLTARLNLADLYQATQRWPQAARQLEKYISIDNQNPNILNQLGAVYLEMANLEKKAQAVLTKSLALNPGQKTAKDLLAKLKKDDLTPKIKVKAKPLNILFVQEAPCIRNYKMTTALRSSGHRVCLAYTKASLSQMYKGLSDNVYNECIQVKNFRELWDLSGNYDILHCHNEPDTLTVAALAGDAPVVHDTHDLISLRAHGDQNLSYFEGVANRGADGRVYTTSYQLEEAKKLYGVEEPTLVFHNYVSEGDLPEKLLPKLSDRDAQVHLVYEGGIGGSFHRDFSSLFIELAKRNIHIHIYPTFYYKELTQLFSPFPNIHYHTPLSPKQIIEEMSQYDFGIIPFNLEKGNKRFLDSTLANKFFEYLAAGLPVITSPLKTYIEYFRKNPVGVTFVTADDVIENIPKLKQIAKETDFSKQIYTYEGEIGRLEEFYYKILDNPKRRGGRSISIDEERVGSPEAKDHQVKRIEETVKPGKRPLLSDQRAIPSTASVTVEEILESSSWNDLVSQSPYALYSHSAEYDEFAFNGKLKKIKISIGEEVYLVPLELTNGLACSFLKYYGGIIPITTYKRITDAYDILCRLVKNNRLNGLLLSYIQKPEYEFVRILEEHIRRKGGQQIKISGWNLASIMSVDRPYQEIWDHSYSANTRSKVRRAVKRGVECRIINITDHIEEAVNCTLSKPIRHGRKLPAYYYDIDLFRQTMERWQKIFGDNMISFGAFFDNKLIAYINTFVRYGEAIANNMLSHAEFWKIYPNNVIFDFMIQYYANRDEVHSIMYSFETLESVDRFKHSMGFEPVPVHRWLMKFVDQPTSRGYNYITWLKAMVGCNANFLTAEEVIEGRKIAQNRPNIVIRHDIDFSPHIALEMAKVEGKLGVKSTFYIFTPDKYKIDFPVKQFQKLERAGWEIGYHTSTEHLEEALSDIKSLKEFYNIRTTVPHMGNLTICKGELAKYIKVLRDGQRFLVQDNGYIADNGGRLQQRISIHNDGTNVWWPVQENHILEFIKRMAPGKVYHFLFHPCWYDKHLNFIGHIPELTPMQRLISEIIKHGVPINEYRALELFGYTGKMHTVDYHSIVASLDVWEIDPKLESELKRNLPGANIYIGDSFKGIKKVTNRYDFVVVDNPMSLSGENDEYCEHFELFPDIFRILSDDSILVVDVIPEINERVKRAYPYLFNQNQLERRKAFYHTNRPENIPIEYMVTVYTSYANNNSFNVEWWFSIQRTHIFYLVLKLQRKKGSKEDTGNKLLAEAGRNKRYPGEQEVSPDGFRKNQIGGKEKDSTFYDKLFLSGGWQKEYHKHYTECGDYKSWEKALEWIKENPSPRIIEIGCGPGQFAQMLFDHGITDYKGIDFSQIAIDMARKNNKKLSHAFMVDNALTSEIFSGGYNIVVVLEVLEHIESDLLLLNKIKKDSTIIFSVPNYNSESHVRWFDSQDSIIKRYGNIIKIEAIEDIPFPPTLNKIYLIKGIKN